MWVGSLALAASLLTHNFFRYVVMGSVIMINITEVITYARTGMYLHDWLDLVLRHRTGYSLSDILHGRFNRHDHDLVYERGQDQHRLLYTYLGRRYCLVWPKQVSHIMTMACTDPNHEDKDTCKKDLMSCLGPHRDFHGVSMTPHLLGHDAVSVSWMNFASLQADMVEREIRGDDFIPIQVGHHA